MTIMNIQNYSTLRDKFNKEKKVSKETLENFGDPLLEQQPQLPRNYLIKNSSNLLNLQNTSEIISLNCLLESV